MKAARYATTVQAELTALIEDEIILARLEREAEEAALREEARLAYQASWDEWDGLLVILRSLDPSDPEYSDIYKDVWGVRPH